MTDASHLTYISKRGCHRGDYPVFYDAFAQSAQSMETLRNALRHKDQKRRLVIYEHDRSAVFFFTVYGWKQEDIFLWIIPVFCVCRQTFIV